MARFLDTRMQEKSWPVRLALFATVAASLAVSGVAGCTKANDPSTSTPTTGPTQGTTASGAATFGLPRDPNTAIRLAALPEISTETPPPLSPLQLAHLDLSIAGQAVEVPVGIGVTKTGRAPTYTQKPGGVIRIEPELKDPLEPPEVITIGQFFTAWGVKLEKNCQATYCTDANHQLLGYYRGQLVPDPASIPITDNAEIYIWYGPKGTSPKAPATFDFPTTKEVG